ncbi:hypothetical protein [Amycolatopsis echigonensis]|uniref:Uncharacterized protein n=1 Tax=Amycolatopsis echigonensis TaxID=2576905 RepID=A0A2N3WE90_9PSEU|nr:MULTISPECIES: hypothetical protein [Amycolatopsis]MBB2499653.1 hypothetical protein [Amycolatopsis echigonensis]PKV92188.1 hypothetical protein ATK30_2984 [Amycolatopsis niigatensis]
MSEIEPRGDTRVARIEGSRADRAVGALGWWLPETAAAGLLAGLAAWAGWTFLLPVIAAALMVRIAWAWPPVRRAARALAAGTCSVAARARRTRPSEQDPAPAGTAVERADEVAS